MKSSDANQSNSMSFPCIILLFLLTLLSLHTAANDNPGKRFISISGKVTGANDQQPLQGVSVTVKGTTTGTATDAEGLFHFNNVDGITNTLLWLLLLLDKPSFELQQLAQ